MKGCGVYLGYGSKGNTCGVGASSLCAVCRRSKECPTCHHRAHTDECTAIHPIYGAAEPCLCRVDTTNGGPISPDEAIRAWADMKKAAHPPLIAGGGIVVSRGGESGVKIEPGAVSMTWKPDPENPDDGDMVYDAATHTTKVWSGSAERWITITGEVTGKVEWSDPGSDPLGDMLKAAESFRGATCPACTHPAHDGEACPCTCTGSGRLHASATCGFCGHPAHDAERCSNVSISGRCPCVAPKPAPKPLYASGGILAPPIYTEWKSCAICSHDAHGPSDCKVVGCTCEGVITVPKTVPSTGTSTKLPPGTSFPGIATVPGVTYPSITATPTDEAVITGTKTAGTDVLDDIGTILGLLVERHGRDKVLSAMPGAQWLDIGYDGTEESVFVFPTTQPPATVADDDPEPVLTDIATVMQSLLAKKVRADMIDAMPGGALTGIATAMRSLITKRTAAAVSTSRIAMTHEDWIEHVHATLGVPREVTGL